MVQRKEQSRLHRRRFLRVAAMGAAGAASVPMLRRYARFLGGGTARALDGAPRRLIIFWTPQGHCTGTDPSGRPMADHAPGGIEPFWPEGNGRDFDLRYDPAAPTPGRILAPLARHADDLLLLRGFNMPHGRVQETAYGHWIKDGPHGAGCMVALTAAPTYVTRSGQQFGGGISIDQHVARHIGDDTPRPSMVLTCGGTKSSYRGYVSYTGPNAPVVPAAPDAAYYSAFGDAVGAEPARMAALRARRASALDLIRDDAARIRRRLPPGERDEMDAHLEALRLLERDLGRDVDCDGGGFTAPAAHFPGHFRQQARTIAAAVACDISRVFCVMASSGGGDTSGNLRYFDPDWTTNYHATGHASGGNSAGGGDDPRVRRRAMEVLIRVSEFYAQWIADLVDALKAIPEGGGTAFDNTLLVWATEMPHGNHGVHQWPWVVAGGSWHFTNGYYWNRPTPVSEQRTSGHGFGHLLTAIARAMGVSTAQFGVDIYSPDDPDSYSALWRHHG